MGGGVARDYDELTFTICNQTQKFSLPCPVQIFVTPTSELVAQGRGDFGPAPSARRRGGKKKKHNNPGTTKTIEMNGSIL